MKNNGFNKSEAFRVVDSLGYLPGSVVSKSILMKTTSVASSAISFNTREI